MTLLPRSSSLISARPIRRQADRPFIRRVPRLISSRSISPSFVRRSFLLPRGGVFARPSLVKRDVCGSKESRRQVLFARGVGGNSWRNRINMEGAYHDGKCK